MCVCVCVARRSAARATEGSCCPRRDCRGRWPALTWCGSNCCNCSGRGNRSNSGSGSRGCAAAVVQAGAAQRQWQRQRQRQLQHSPQQWQRHPALCQRFHALPRVAMLSGGASGGHGGNAGSGGPPKLAITVCGRRWRGAPAVAVAAPAVEVAAPAVATQSRVLQASPLPTESALKRWRGTPSHLPAHWEKPHGRYTWARGGACRSGRTYPRDSAGVRSHISRSLSLYIYTYIYGVYIYIYMYALSTIGTKADGL